MIKTTTKLNSGYTIPVLGLGTWRSESPIVGNAVEYAISKAGYRHIDCARIYGNEKEIGSAFKKVIGSSVKREDLFVTSKLWNTNHRPDEVEKACIQTLKDLRLEYLDLYLMHWGIAFKPGNDLEPLTKDGRVIRDNVPISDTWTAMENLVKKGLVRSVGVANFTAAMLVDLLTYANIKPAMNQIELHPYNSQNALVQFCKDEEVAVTAYSPLGRQGVHNNSRQGPRLFDDPVIKKVAKKHKKTQAQILLNWAISRGTIVIPKSTAASRIEENFDIFGFELDDREKKEIDSLNRDYRFVNTGPWWGVPYFY